MLYRANSALPERESRFDEAIYRGQKWLIAQQREDGTWYDTNWGLYDACSVNVGTLMFGRMLPGVPKKIRDMLDEPWIRGMEFIMNSQGEDGSWGYKEKYETPVCVTAHLLQKTVAYGEKGRIASTKAVSYLNSVQHEEGHYDNKDTDNTCDSIRALMLASELLDDFSSHETIVKGYKWLLESRNEDDGWGEKQGDPTDYLMVMDMLDTILKFERYMEIYEKNCCAKL
jgi:squalene cyclase